MKNVIIIFAAFMMLILAACTHHHHSSNGIPPGQHKKLHGSKSAKAYAPGQKKKH